jgi:hypothetical protein
MNEDLKEFYLTWVQISKIIPSNRLEIQRGELLTQKLLNLSSKIELELEKEVTV